MKYLSIVRLINKSGALNEVVSRATESKVFFGTQTVTLIKKLTTVIFAFQRKITLNLLYCSVGLLFYVYMAFTDRPT